MGVRPQHPRMGRMEPPVAGRNTRPRRRRRHCRRDRPVQLAYPDARTDPRRRVRARGDPLRGRAPDPHGLRRLRRKGHRAGARVPRGHVRRERDPGRRLRGRNRRVPRMGRRAPLRRRAHREARVRKPDSRWTGPVPQDYFQERRRRVRHGREERGGAVGFRRRRMAQVVRDRHSHRLHRRRPQAYRPRSPASPSRYRRRST